MNNPTWSITVHPNQANAGYVLVFSTLADYLKWQMNPELYTRHVQSETLKAGTYYPTEEFTSGQRKYAVTTYDNIQQHPSGMFQVWAVPHEYYERQ